MTIKFYIKQAANIKRLNDFISILKLKRCIKKYTKRMIRQSKTSMMFNYDINLSDEEIIKMVKQITQIDGIKVVIGFGCFIKLTLPDNFYKEEK